MLESFKIKPFDLEPIYASWTDGPRFIGNAKKDPPVDEWLEQIRIGCTERHIPEEYWYKVAQHFMGPKARARLEELKQVVVKVNGGKYRWTWKKFRIAVQNMGWGIDKAATQTIKVQGKPSGLWFMRKKDDSEENIAPPVDTKKRPPPPSRSATVFWGSKNTSEVDKKDPSPRRQPARAATDSAFWPIRRQSKEDVVTSSQRPGHQKAKSDSAVTTKQTSQTHKPSGTRSRANTADGHSGEVTTVTQAPIWLLNACTALEYITSEHPKTMSIISAILITAGSIPAIPAISAGAGGAVLASGAAHAIGAIAVGLGQALSSSMKTTQENGHAQASSTVR